MEETLLLQAKHIKKQFAGVYALTEGSLNLKKGSIHALCGGNGAGKSTFLNILMGVFNHDGGDILLDGKQVNFDNPAQALAAGIAIITQELSPIPYMSVAENIFLGREPMCIQGLFIDYAQMLQQSRDLLCKLNFDVDSTMLMVDLSLAQVQLIEIAKAISHHGRILIMDEPTSAIGEAETAILFAAITQLKAQGVGIIYVTHRLSEIFQIADEYTVFRDGCFIEQGLIKDINREYLVQKIVGHKVMRSLRDNASNADDLSQEILLNVSDYSRIGTRTPSFNNIDLNLKKGEILGIYGLMGAGRSAFLNTLYGLAKPDRGLVQINGKEVHIQSPKDAINAGMAFIPKDRKGSGIVGCRSIRENITLTALPKFSPFGWLNRQYEALTVNKMKEMFNIRMSSMDLWVEQLSGGNQQKVVFSKVLLTDPKILLCDEPTRGVDEGAKQEIYKFLSSFVATGKGVIVISSELDEILQISDRILVFKKGKIVEELQRGEATHESLTSCAS